MKRGYTVAEYREMHGPHPKDMDARCVAITSDFIVGFSGETEADFQRLMDLVTEECRFKNSFIFKYSERPGTKASDRNFRMTYPSTIKQVPQQRVAGTFRIEISEARQSQAIPRAERCRGAGRGTQQGQTLPIAVYDANAHTLFGAVVTEHVGPEVFSLSAPPA